MMAGSKLFGLHTQLDIEQILQEAQHRWLRPAEICEILRNYQNIEITSEPPNRPPCGSIFLFDRKVIRYFRKDGHNWKKKSDGKTVNEAHERLKSGSVEVLHCYYAHGEENKSFQRRCYWLLEEELSHIVLVHYQVIKGNKTNKKRIRDPSKGDVHNTQVNMCASWNMSSHDHQIKSQNTVDYPKTSQSIDTGSLSSAQNSEYEAATIETPVKICLRGITSSISPLVTSVLPVSPGADSLSQKRPTASFPDPRTLLKRSRPTSTPPEIDLEVPPPAPDKSAAGPSSLPPDEILLRAQTSDMSRVELFEAYSQISTRAAQLQSSFLDDYKRLMSDAASHEEWKTNLLALEKERDTLRATLSTLEKESKREISSLHCLVNDLKDKDEYNLQVVESLKSELNTSRLHRDKAQGRVDTLSTRVAELQGSVEKRDTRYEALCTVEGLSHHVRSSPAGIELLQDFLSKSMTTTLHLVKRRLSRVSKDFHPSMLDDLNSEA